VEIEPGFVKGRDLIFGICALDLTLGTTSARVERVLKELIELVEGEERRVKAGVKYTL